MISNVAELEANLSEPTAAVIETMRRLDGDLMILGVGGKMGPTLARMARRASDAAGVKRRVIGVSRFSSAALPDALKSHGIESIAADLLDREQIAKLPDVPNIVFMAGMKFGSTGQEALTWAMNCHVPALVCERFGRSRIVAFSTGNVYGLVPVISGGSKESDPLRPIGDYAMSCVGRERIFEHFSLSACIPLAILRLNYAVELRYGVLVDVAQKVWTGRPVDVSMGYVNVIWQQEANAMALNAFNAAATPARFLNIAGPQIWRIRDVTERFASLMGREAIITDVEAPDALLNDASSSYPILGSPCITVEQMCDWIAPWVMHSHDTLNKPTHFESRDGTF